VASENGASIIIKKPALATQRHRNFWSDANRIFIVNPPTVSNAEKGATLDLRYHGLARLFQTVQYTELEPAQNKPPPCRLGFSDQFINAERTSNDRIVPSTTLH
jgi:hypothetical protein